MDHEFPDVVGGYPRVGAGRVDQVQRRGADEVVAGRRGQRQLGDGEESAVAVAAVAMTGTTASAAADSSAARRRTGTLRGIGFSLIRMCPYKRSRPLGTVDRTRVFAVGLALPVSRADT